MKKTQEEIGSVYFKIDSLDTRRFLDLIKDHENCFCSDIDRLNRSVYVENYRGQGDVYSWVRTTYVKEGARLITLGELEEMVKGSKPLYMRDLDNTRYYGLSGLSPEQADTLFEWLVKNDRGWNNDNRAYLGEYNALAYVRGQWAVSSGVPDTPILDLFKPLEEVKKKRTKEVIEKEIKALQDELKELEALIEGDYVVTAKGIVGIVTSVDLNHRTGFPYEINGDFRTRKPEKINPDLTIAQFVAMQKINGDN